MEKYAKNRKWNMVIDNLYTYGMILVVLGHISLDESFAETYLCRWIYSFHMPLFFWISGYLFHKNRSFGKFVAVKSRRLLIPLFVLTSVAFIPKIVLSKFAIHPVSGGFDSYLNAFIYPYDNPILLLWFLPVLFCIYILAFLFSPKVTTYHESGKDTFCKIRQSILWMIYAVVSIGLFYVFPSIDFLAISSILYHFPYFCIGAVCRIWIDKKVGNPDSKIYNGCVVMIFTILYSLLILTDVDRYFLSVFGIFTALSLSGNISRFDIPIFRQLRPYSFTIYLLQWFPQCFVRIVCFQILHIDLYICYVLMFISGLYVPYFIGKVCDRLIPHTGIFRYMRLSIGLQSQKSTRPYEP